MACCVAIHAKSAILFVQLLRWFSDASDLTKLTLTKIGQGPDFACLNILDFKSRGLVRGFSLKSKGLKRETD